MLCSESAQPDDCLFDRFSRTPVAEKDLIRTDEIGRIIRKSDRTAGCAARYPLRKCRTMVTVDEFSEVVSAVYAAAVTPERWDKALVALVNVFGGTGGGIGLAWPSPNRAEMVCNVGVEPSARRTYNQYYGRLDHVVAAIRGGPVGVVRTGTELILPHTDSEFHVDWIRPNDLEDGLFVRLTDGAICHWLGIAAPRRGQPFGDAERSATPGSAPQLRGRTSPRDRRWALYRCVGIDQCHSSVCRPSTPGPRGLRSRRRSLRGALRWFLRVSKTFGSACLRRSRGATPCGHGTVGHDMPPSSRPDYRSGPRTETRQHRSTAALRTDQDRSGRRSSCPPM